MKAIRFLAVLLAPFIFSTAASAQVFDSGPSDPALFATVFNLPMDVLPDNLASIDAETIQINVTGGGFAGDSIEVGFGREVNISGGSVGDNFDAFDGSEVNISGGAVGNGFRSFVTEVNISGGSVGNNFGARQSVVNISGGSIGDNFDANSSVVNMSGGSVGDNFEVFNRGTVNLLGSHFVLDGVTLDDLTEDQAFTIVDRDVTLSGLLTDGSAFSFDLNSEDFAIGGSTLTVTFTPQVLLGDINRDGVVNFLDIAPFILFFSVANFQVEGDINGDGIVDFFDIAPFIALLSS